MRTKGPNDGPMLVGVGEIAKIIGVSPAFLRQLVRDKRIPFYRVSERTARFDIDEVREYMRQNATK